MSKQKKIFRGKLNFSKDELSGRLSLGATGISMPYRSEGSLDYYRKGYSRQKTSLNFGMFGNDPKYYGDVRDTAPKPEDFIEMPFRLISATVVGGGTWKATDFSDTKVLKKSTPLLDGVPLYKEHENDVDNWVGLVNGVKWSKETTTSSGIKVPAGINGIVAIDKVTNPKIARGVQMGIIFSNSVTVEFDWEMSHDFENEWDFLNKIGTIGSDGTMVRRIVKNIHNYHESSLVWLGADPFAKALNENGDVHNIDIGSVYSYTKNAFTKSTKKPVEVVDNVPEDVESARNIAINFAIDKNVLSLARRKTNFNKDRDMKEFIAAFIATFGESLGITDTDLTQEQLIEYSKKLSYVSDDAKAKQVEAMSKLKVVEDAALEVAKEEGSDTVDVVEFMKSHKFVANDTLVSLNKAKTDFDALQADKDALDAKVAELSKTAEIGKKYLGMQRAEAIRLYKLSVGAENADEAVIAMFNKAEDGAVEGLLKQYTKTATAKFSGKCNACGSTDFSFRSTLADDDGILNDTPDVVALTTEEIFKQHAENSMYIGRIKE